MKCAKVLFIPSMHQLRLLAACSGVWCLVDPESYALRICAQLVAFLNGAFLLGSLTVINYLFANRLSLLTATTVHQKMQGAGDKSDDTSSALTIAESLRQATMSDFDAGSQAILAVAAKNTLLYC